MQAQVKDLTDLRAVVGSEHLQEVLVNNTIEIPETSLNDQGRNGSSARRIEPTTREKKRPLTIRRIDEILEMTFDEAEFVLANGYLTLGECTAICGMGGVGKSRLTMQLALCCRSGRDFLGWATQGKDLRWLFLQTENSCRRLKFDLERMLKAFTPEERDAILEGVFFHTLESDEDGLLMLDFENSERVMRALDETCADVCVYDPLRDFGVDDLNSDKYMTETLREISRITRRGNPKRVPLVIHHAGTGKAGIQKTTGYDRSSFGRNSKVLFSWARAQINVAPADAADNGLIVLASAKCSNSLEFEPFAARLDDETMLYRREDDFDFNEWRQALESTRGGQAIPTVSMILEMIPADGSIAKTTVIELLGERNIGEKRARAFLGATVTGNGPIYEWHIKRSGKRDEIHLSRVPQPADES